MTNKHHRMVLEICGGSACLSNRSLEIKQSLEKELKEHGLDREIGIETAGCHGFCDTGPVLVVKPDNIHYNHLEVKDIPHLVEEHFLKGRPVKKHMFIPPADTGGLPKLSELDFFKKQMLVALRNRGVIDAEKIDDYIARDGYEALARALTDMTPGGIVDEIKRSGLRGRGGAGFSTGLKWEMVAGSQGEKRYLVCNADEGDPGAYMDRSIVEGDPHSVLEGMLIGARAVGAREGFVYIRNEYPLAVKRMGLAIEQAREYGLLGENILGTDFSFDIKVIRGAGAFVCGEETSLISSLEGYLAEPRPRPPYPAESGLWGQPTNINNVETWANVPVIINRGADWFSSIGTTLSKGTKVFSVVGKVKNTGLVEVPMGMSLGEIIFDICGGIANDRKFKAVQIGGPSGGCIPKSLLNLPVDYESLKEAGSMMGSGGMVVTDESTCMVDMAHFFLTFLKEECCGKCTPCREGVPRMLEVLDRIKQGRAEMSDLDTLEEIAAVVKDTALCGLGTTAPNSVLTTLRYFRKEYEDHILRKRCEAGVCSHLVSAPCHHACPIDTEASSYVALIAQGKFQEAAEINYLNNPLPSVCARVCHHPCEERCRAGEISKPVAVRNLKRFVTDYMRVNGNGKMKIQPSVKQEERVAVVGSGPSGLMAAWELAKTGYPVTVFEAEKVPGGMLSWGIPEYRLPKDILNQEIDGIRRQGVEIITGTRIGSDLTLEDLKSQGFGAVYIATGAARNMSLGIPGEDSAGVIDPIQFLKNFNLEGRAEIGKAVAVVGGGNTALDAARTALRLGADVTILYRRTRKEMPAIQEEIDAALEEGVKIEYLTLPVEAFSENGHLTRIKCTRMAPGEFDKSGRHTPVPLEGSEFELEIDTLIPAIGQKPDLRFINGGGLKTTAWDTLDANLETTALGPDGLFAGGDVVSGAGTVLEAMRMGKTAAGAIHRYLRGESPAPHYAPTEPRLEVPAIELSEEDWSLERPEMPTLPAGERVSGFAEVELGYSAEEAMLEARRCLRCDLDSLRRKGEST